MLIMPDKNEKENLADVQRGMRKFIIRMFIIGVFLGVTGSVFYGHFGKSQDKFFHSFIIFAGLAFTFPMFTISVRLMLRMFYMSYEGMEKQNDLIERLKETEEEAGPIIQKIEKIINDKAEPIVNKIEQVIDKALPIAENVEDVVKRAKGMAEDIEQVAHKVRTLTESLNGHLDFKNVEGKLDKVADSLNTIASVFKPFSGKKAANDEEEGTPPSLIPAFDPLKAGGRRRGS